jgi:hypothetical protein
MILTRKRPSPLAGCSTRLAPAPVRQRESTQESSHRWPLKRLLGRKPHDQKAVRSFERESGRSRSAAVRIGNRLNSAASSERTSRAALNGCLAKRSDVANLFDPAGKPFGWAHHAERDHIRQHLRRRIWKFGFDEFRVFRMEQRINEIQRRLHKYDETFAQRSRRWAEEQRLRCAREATGADLGLTRHEEVTSSALDLGDAGSRYTTDT